MQIEDKKSLRVYFKNLRHEMLQNEKKILDSKIFNKLKDLKFYQSSKSILVYVSSEIEVNTYRLMEYSWEIGKKVLAPRCIPDTNLMEFFQITSFDDLEKGSFGIYEPKKDCKKIQDFDSGSCCIVPALAYDIKGCRLGFGKGFYDRFLMNFKGRKVGLCYSNCIMERLPVNEYDLPVDCVVTDDKVMFFER